MIPLPLSLTIRSALLFVEAQRVIWLRMIRLAAGGDPAERELRRMWGEKLQASTDVAMTVAAMVLARRPASSVANRAIRGLSTRVRRNRKRLS
jgi:hypothetical protein